MAKLHGKNANIYWDRLGVDTNLTQGQIWSVDATHDVAEKTGMGDTWKTYIGGFRDWSASVTCLLPLAGSDISVDSGSSPNGLADVKAQLELYVVWDTGTPLYKSVYGNAICNGISFAADKDGIATVIFSFQGSGRLQWDSGVARP
ncbi:hypothetical protein LCGC14_0421500 [marine sediment metagenome]|uniref:Uncharacterized protein n=1 Tax=marine sediment metagenome TaxID=412755 RepID=A0A0F9W056_9ZZZZ